MAVAKQKHPGLRYSSALHNLPAAYAGEGSAIKVLPNEDQGATCLLAFLKERKVLMDLLTWWRVA